MKSSKHYIYKAIKDDRVLYVGITTSLERRFSQHSKGSAWWDEKDYMVFTLVENETIARIYEMYYMNKFKTKYNIQDQRFEYVGNIGLSSLKFEKYKDKQADYSIYKWLDKQGNIYYNEKPTSVKTRRVGYNIKLNKYMINLLLKGDDKFE